MGKYFSKFGTIIYNDQMAKNIMSRPALMRKAKESSTTFYKYSLPEEKRADVISYEYYDHPDYAWLIYLANNIVDPYTDYFQSDTNLKLAIIKKYGSLDIANNSVARWSYNWAVDQRELNPVQYEALPGPHKKYWDGIIANAYSSPYKYVRRRTDISVETNRVLIIKDLDAHEYEPGQVYIGKDVTDTEFRAIVKSAGNGIITLYHIMGQVAGDQYVEIPNSIYDIANIPADELMYWYPVTCLEDEFLKNSAKKDIVLVNKHEAYVIEKDLRKTLNE